MTTLNMLWVWWMVIAITGLSLAFLAKASMTLTSITPILVPYTIALVCWVVLGYPILLLCAWVYRRIVNRESIGKGVEKL